MIDTREDVNEAIDELITLAYLEESLQTGNITLTRTGLHYLMTLVVTDAKESIARNSLKVNGDKEFLQYCQKRLQFLLKELGNREAVLVALYTTLSNKPGSA